MLMVIDPGLPCRAIYKQTITLLYLKLLEEIRLNIQIYISVEKMQIKEYIPENRHRNVSTKFV